MVQSLRYWAPNAGVMGSIPDWGTKILHASRYSWKKEYERFHIWVSVVLVTQSSPILWDSVDYKPVRLLCPWNFPGKNTGVDRHSLLQGIFPAWGSNPGLLHGRQILCSLSHQGSPYLNQDLPKSRCFCVWLLICFWPSALQWPLGSPDLGGESCLVLTHCSVTTSDSHKPPSPACPCGLLRTQLAQIQPSASWFLFLSDFTPAAHCPLDHSCQTSSIWGPVCQLRASRLEHHVRSLPDVCRVAASMVGAADGATTDIPGVIFQSSTV